MFAHACITLIHAHMEHDHKVQQLTPIQSYTSGILIELPPFFASTHRGARAESGGGRVC